MQTVKLVKYNNKLCYYRRSDSNEYLTALLMDETLINERSIPFYSEIATHKEHSQKVKDETLMVDAYYVYLPLPMIEYLNTVANSLGYEFDMSDIDMIPLIQRPEGELRSTLEKYYTQEFSDKLLGVIDEMANHRYGLINLPTGFGKSWLIVGLLRIFCVQNKNDNILCIADGSAVVNELRSRAEYMKLNEDFKGRFEIVNTASVDAMRFDTPEMGEWLKSVGLILIDECDNITPTLKTFLDKKLPNYKSIFGFSASPDRVNGQKMDMETIKFNKLTHMAYKVLKYVGFSFITEEPKIPVSLHVIYSKFTKRKYLDFSEFIKFKQMVDFVALHKNFVKVLKHISENSIDTVYVPTNSTKRILKIIKNIQTYAPELTYVFWDAGSIWDSQGRVFKDNIELRDFYKDTPRGLRPRIIFSTRTSFKGISIPQITDIVYIENCNYGNVIQTIGRTYRSSDPAIWIVQENDPEANNLYRATTFKRLRIIRDTYTIKEETSIVIE